MIFIIDYRSWKYAILHIVSMKSQQWMEFVEIQYCGKS
jgi:hypothetical protein